MNTKFHNQRGAFLVIFALILLVLLGFTALGIEAGRWYLVRAELSKSVDAAALVAAKNIADPHYDSKKLAEEFGYENFNAGYLGSPQSGSGTVLFTATPIDSETFQVTGNVDATATLARVFGMDRIPVVAIAAAQSASVKFEGEIMLVLDRTGSMGMPMTKMNDLKSAATSFEAHFEGIKGKVKMGLISFANDVTLDASLEDGLAKNKLANAINALQPNGSTNMAGGLERAAGPAALNVKKPKVEQFVIFFSDGMPTAVQGTFTFYNQKFDAVVGVAGDLSRFKEAINCRPDATGYDAPGPWDIYLEFLVPNAKYGSEGSYISISGATPQWYAGDGKDTNKSKCSPFGRGTVKWDLFSTGWPGGPVPGYQPDSCIYQSYERKDVVKQACTIARNMTIAKAQELKDRGIIIYVVGLGTANDIDIGLLTEIASRPTNKYLFTTDDSSELTSIFNLIAKDIKPRLVQ